MRLGRRRGGKRKSDGILMCPAAAALLCRQSSSAHTKQPGFLGLRLSSDLPHAVQEVDDLADKHSTVQGQPGYCNEEVQVGDLVLEIDGRDVTRLSIADLHDLLRGEIYTLVEITLKRRQSAAVYAVEVLRHRFHEFDVSPGTPPKEAADRETEGQRGIEREVSRGGQEQGRTTKREKEREKEQEAEREREKKREWEQDKEQERERQQEQERERMREKERKRERERERERESEKERERHEARERERDQERDSFRQNMDSTGNEHDELKHERPLSRRGKDDANLALSPASDQQDEIDIRNRLQPGSSHLGVYNRSALSPPSLDTSPPTVHANDTASIANGSIANGSESGRALFEQLRGLELRLDGSDRRSDLSPGSASDERNNSAQRHATLNDKAHRLLQACRRAQNVLEELVANVGKLPAKRQSLRMAGSNTRTTVLHAYFSNCVLLWGLFRAYPRPFEVGQLLLCSASQVGRFDSQRDCDSVL